MESARNIYKDDINFVELASQDADFGKVLKSNGQLDFSDPGSVEQLTKSLLKRDFNILLALPPDRLCPPVPNRLNYVLWIQDLIDTSSSTYSDQYDLKQEVIGLDIGTGASCIYPLLGCAQRPNWTFIGTDIDDQSLQYAKSNVRQNKLEYRIKLHRSAPEDPLLPLDIFGLQRADFAMTNPPFYSNTAELLTSASLKSRPPFTACTGSASEMVTPGGETAFVTRLISESLVLRSRIRWYTAMLGKLSSVSSLVATLREHRVDNYAVTEFIQGTKTRRWGLAWSFGDHRPAMAAARAARGAGIPKGLLPFPSEYVITLPINTTGLLVRTTTAIDATLTSLQLQWQWEPAISTGVGFTSKNVWSRSARRKSAHMWGDQGGSDDTEDEMLFGFKIMVWEGQSKEEKQSQMVQDAGQEVAIHVLVRWLKGHDSILFESFCGMLKRKLGA